MPPYLFRIKTIKRERILNNDLIIKCTYNFLQTTSLDLENLGTSLT